MDNDHDKVMNAAADAFRSFSGYRMRLLQHYCQSPIEILLGATLWTIWDLDHPNVRQRLAVGSRRHLSNMWDESEAMLVPQYPVEAFKLDFVLIWRPLRAYEVKVGIECDGHDFHEKTKSQAARDKGRDRTITATGIPVYRFTGSEIHRDPGKCAYEIIAAADEDFRRQQEASPE